MGNGWNRSNGHPDDKEADGQTEGDPALKWRSLHGQTMRLPGEDGMKIRPILICEQRASRMAF